MKRDQMATAVLILFVVLGAIALPSYAVELRVTTAADLVLCANGAAPSRVQRANRSVLAAGGDRGHSGRPARSR